MIGEYPKFTPINLGLKSEVDNFTKNFDSYSDFNFTSLYCWNIEGRTEVAFLHKNLVVKQDDYLTGNPIVSLLGINKVKESLSLLLQDFNSLALVPEVTVNSIKSSKSFKIQEDRDNFDYVYDIKHLSLLSGMGLKKKRNKYNQFVSTLGGKRAEVKIYKKLDDIISQLRQVNKQWEDETSLEEGDFTSETKAVEILFKDFPKLNQLLTTVEIDGEIQGYSVNEVIGNGWSSCLFEKAIKTYGQNIYVFLARETSKILESRHCKQVNWMQDLGLEGLRKSKLSYQPDKFLKKYSVKLI